MVHVRAVGDVNLPCAGLAAVLRARGDAERLLGHQEFEEGDAAGGKRRGPRALGGRPCTSAGLERQGAFGGTSSGDDQWGSEICARRPTECRPSFGRDRHRSTRRSRTRSRAQASACGSGRPRVQHKLWPRPVPAPWQSGGALFRTRQSWHTQPNRRQRRKELLSCGGGGHGSRAGAAHVLGFWPWVSSLCDSSRLLQEQHPKKRTTRPHAHPVPRCHVPCTSRQHASVGIGSMIAC